MSVKGILFLALTLLFISCKNRTEKIAIQPYNNISQNILDSVKSVLVKNYKFEIVLLPSINLPICSKVPNRVNRFRADSLLIHLKKIKPDTIDYIIGITSEDISITKRDKQGNIRTPEKKYADWGVFGLGYMPGVACVVSTYRINETHPNFYSRLKKIAVHEIGHNLGLDHCKLNSCVMRDAVETIQSIDEEKEAMCENCKRMIRE